MPDRALDYRALQLSYLSGRAHDLATGKKYRNALEKAAKEKRPLDSKEAANVRVMREELERAIRIPTKLVEEESAATTHAAAHVHDFECDIIHPQGQPRRPQR